MKIGDLVTYKQREDLQEFPCPWHRMGIIITEDENYDAWLGLIIGENFSGQHTVQWVCSDGRGDVEEVNHTPQELVLVNEDR